MEYKYIAYCTSVYGHYSVDIRVSSFADVYRTIRNLRFRDETLTNIDLWHCFGDDSDDE